MQEKLVPTHHGSLTVAGSLLPPPESSWVERGAVAKNGLTCGLFRYIALILGLAAIVVSSPLSLAMVGTAGSTIAVVYPDVPDPYRGVFSQIIDGIQDVARGPIVTIPIAPSADLQSAIDSLKSKNIRVVIALGRNGMRVANALGNGVTVVGGCVISVPEAEAASQTVFSLAPEPSLLFARLKQLKPSVTRVHVVFDPAQSGWLIQRARDAAKPAHIELVAHEASDLKTALHVYQEILSGIDPQKDSLWLPQDTTTVEESAVLPLLLQEAWNRELILFSSNITHVKRGALFSLYPDNHELGRHLGHWVTTSASGTPSGLMPLTDVLMAVNIRTAAHLELQISDAQRRGFNLIFPED